MNKYLYKFELVQGKYSIRKELWAWKWGNWYIETKWTSADSPDADSSTDKAKDGLSRGGKLLMLAVPSRAYSLLPKAIDSYFDSVSIFTFKPGQPTKTPLRTTIYSAANILHHPIPKDFRNIPHAGEEANYIEVLLTIDKSVSVF